jgi:hypothetical protein
MPQNDLSLHIHAGDPGEPLRLSGHANLYQTAELHAALCRHVVESDRPALDLSELVSCDTLSLQLLLALGQRAVMAGTMPSCVEQRCAALGLPLPLVAAADNPGGLSRS